MGVRGGAAGWDTALQAGRTREFFFESFRPHYGPAVDSASNRNAGQEGTWGVKEAGA
jgi:hypothetical protein